MHRVGIIALDLDGTLLNSRKELSNTDAAALAHAALLGIEIVPTTGRFFNGMPEVIRKLPYINYAITMNGAQVYDIQRKKCVYRAEIPVTQAIAIMKYLDDYPVIYDCFMDNWGWMTQKLQEKAEEFAPDVHYAKMIRTLRTPVPDLKAYLREKKLNIQKIQLFCKSQELRQFLMKELGKIFNEIVVTSSIINNIEINNIHANKGRALRSLAVYLGITMKDVAAFGDGCNDMSMIQEAGVGIAMGNAHPDIKASADYITRDCDHHGVAVGIEKYLL